MGFLGVPGFLGAPVAPGDATDVSAASGVLSSTGTLRLFGVVCALAVAMLAMRFRARASEPHTDAAHQGQSALLSIGGLLVSCLGTDGDDADGVPHE